MVCVYVFEQLSHLQLDGRWVIYKYNEVALVLGVSLGLFTDLEKLCVSASSQLFHLNLPG